MRQDELQVAQTSNTISEHKCKQQDVNNDNLKTKIINCNQTDDIAMSSFITNLELHKKFYCYWEDSAFDDASVTIIMRFFVSSIGKIHKLGKTKLRELEAPSLTN